MVCGMVCRMCNRQSVVFTLGVLPPTHVGSCRFIVLLFFVICFFAVFMIVS